jgi:hypothetical protein
LIFTPGEFRKALGAFPTAVANLTLSQLGSERGQAIISIIPLPRRRAA